MLGTTNRMRKLIEYPPNLRAYYTHLRDLISICYNPGYATRWANHYAALLSDNSLTGYISYITTRAAYVQSQIPAFPAFSITTSNGLDFVAGTNLVTLVGNAPLGLRYLSVNGEVFAPAWPNATNWSLQLALPHGSNTLVLQALDAQGQVLTNLTDTIHITVDATLDDPVGKIVINEIMFRSTVPGTEFVEIWNTSDTTAFDLRGWHLNGTGVSFDSATVLPPRGFLVLPKDRLVFGGAYGYSLPAVTEMPGRLDLDGETLSLIKPAAGNEDEVVVDRVRFEPSLPWPGATNGWGQSLQLIDASIDNARASDWSDGAGWRFFSFTGPMNSSRLSFFFDNFGGDIYLDDFSLVAGSVPGVGINSMVNGDFESPLAPAWITTSFSTNSHLTNGFAHSGGSSLHLVQQPGAIALTLFYQDVNPPVVTNSTYTLSGWYLTNGTNTNFTIRSSTAFQAKPNVRPVGPTPGGPNLKVDSLPPYPPLWLNEVVLQNTNGPSDHLGDRDPWLELYNAGPTPVSLDGMYLADNYVSLTQWPFPSNAAVAPGGFLVIWCDGEPQESTALELHTSFRLSPDRGSVVLSRTIGAAAQILDYFNYPEVPANQSYGSLPDGQPFYRGVMYRPTPGVTNDGSSAPIMVFINEWMAANTSAGGFADPADGKYDDWFELYNPGAGAVDLGGYFLTDNLTNKFQFEIPNNSHYTVPAGGYLLVWADSTPSQNSTNRPDLHTSFNLRAAGEAIGLFAPNGTQIDAVTFTNQVDNLSMGRRPDGSASIITLPVPSPRGSNGVAQPPQSPEFTGVTFTGANQVQITVSSIPGRTYQVEFKDDLSTPLWSPLGGPRLANGQSLVVSDALLPARQRFYRVALLP